jgi:hypothetical protein
MLDVPEIKEIWDTIQQNKHDFQQQLDQWIKEAQNAINTFAKNYEHNDFPPEQGNIVAWGILAEAFKKGLDFTDAEQRMKATDSLLSQISWAGATEYMSDMSATRTRQLSRSMNVPKEVMKSFLLAAGGQGPVSLGGGGSINELTNWDGTKKNTGWGR